MEGIEHNPVVYELMSEMAFRDEKVQVKVYYFLFRFSVFYKSQPFLVDVIILCETSLVNLKKTPNKRVSCRYILL